MKKLFLPSSIVATIAGAALLCIAAFTVRAQVVQTEPQNAQDLKANSQAAPNAPAVPPELQKLVGDFLYAFGKGDEVAMAACWYAPQAPSGTVSLPVVPASGKRELPPGKVAMPTTLENAFAKEQILRLRTLCSRLFGSPEQLKLLRVDFGGSERTSVGPNTSGDNVQIHLMAGDLHIVLSIEDVEKINGGWKFKGRMSNELTILVPSAQ